MTTTTDKNKVIGSILRLTKKTDSPDHFDKLLEKDVKYLGKLLNCCKNLKKVK